MNLARFFSLTLIIVILSCGCADKGDGSFSPPQGTVSVTFSVTADMRDYTGDNRGYFRGACERIESGGAGLFMISPGDIDPPDRVLYTITEYIGPDYTWYPVTGNHESETPEDMEWLRSYNTGGASLPGIVNTGPPGSIETTFSFEHGDTHFIVLNQYYDGTSDTGTDGDVADALHEWLVSDLGSNTKSIVLVFGHEPAWPQPDIENGRLRHEDDSLNIHQANRDRFWNTLASAGVTAYICGHTHNYSRIKINGVWQIDAGHSRGMGDIGAKSTFLIFYIMENGSVFMDTHRMAYYNGRYYLYERIQLN